MAVNDRMSNEYYERWMKHFNENQKEKDNKYKQEQMAKKNENK